ncbi:MAG TPA: RDD family protein [Holophagaceae bacterium]|nr:RDD family protein [Holophagaceae bacterium]
MNEFNPYEAPQAVVEDIPPSEGWVLADRGTRLGAALLDGISWMVLFLPLVFLLILSGPGRTDGGAGIHLVWELLLGAALIGLGIWNLIWLHQNGQTIGKRILGIRIVRCNGERASLGRIFWLRGALTGAIGAIPFFFLGRIFSLVDALFIFGQEKRCIHDVFADTIVIRA